MQTISLPKPVLDSEQSVEAALRSRRSIREYSAVSIGLAEIGQLLWAAQGITSSDGDRTAPSAGALFPLELYVVAGDVQGLPPGVYRYRPGRHDLRITEQGDVRAALATAALAQHWIANGPAIIVLSAVYQRTLRKYDERGRRYVHMEVGHAAQNIYLQAESLGLGTVMVGAFEDDEVSDVLGLPDDHAPLGLMPVGVR